MVRVFWVRTALGPLKNLTDSARVQHNYFNQSGVDPGPEILDSTDSKHASDTSKRLCIGYHGYRQAQVKR